MNRTEEGKKEHTQQKPLNGTKNNGEEVWLERSLFN